MSDGVSGKPVLGAIRAVTCTVPDLHSVESAYSRYLDYRVVESGRIPDDVAQSWNAPRAAGSAYITLEPASGEAVHLRFIESATSAGSHALTTHGWNVSELVVQNVDALADKLRESPFRIIGPPKNLTRLPMIRAMQVLGPAGECLYFAQIGPGSGLELAVAESFVGRVFIVVAGGPDLSALFATYSQFANGTRPPVFSPIEVISKANGLPPDTEHGHGLVRLTHGTLIELDGYPPNTTPRALDATGLPAGMAIVSFEFSGLGTFTQARATRALLPGAGHTVTFKGACGELIELVESQNAGAQPAHARRH